MDWLTEEEAANKWSIKGEKKKKMVTVEQVKILCDRGLVKGAKKEGDTWIIPKVTKRPKIDKMLASCVKDIIDSHGTDCILSKRKIEERFEKIFYTKPTGMQLTDFCYNRVCKASDESEPCFFVYLGEKEYLGKTEVYYSVLGPENKKFNGDIFAKPTKWKKDEKVGDCINGERRFDKLKMKEIFQKNVGQKQKRNAKPTEKPKNEKSAKLKQQRAPNTEQEEQNEAVDFIQPASNNTISQIKTSPSITALSAEDYETQIYKNCINYERKPIFDRVPETKEIWNNIKTVVKSRDEFGVFIRALYQLIFETTKDEDPLKKDSNGKPVKIFRLPKDFTKGGTETKRFMGIVDILRHTLGEAHTPSKLKIPDWKISYSKALKILLGSRMEPQSPEDFCKLQGEIIKQFDHSMKTLLEIVKKELECSQ